VLSEVDLICREVPTTASATMWVDRSSPTRGEALTPVMKGKTLAQEEILRAAEAASLFPSISS
jgi:hypothetical protein